jgi:hypothetical protein
MVRRLERLRYEGVVSGIQFATVAAFSSHTCVYEPKPSIKSSEMERSRAPGGICW